ncbi:Myb-like DNA-binding domain containing protein [Tritrichomonas foetus]|uniref:Myb-like DNA-binding domain containing protein n=1 Tax=Tritrichomonas foetus TaxID=1144522 RepID=A0A1J4JPW4_9EUKA|nr:Myb-like DNA-binding domain containing protein [Tritrichomonas foetus]|eukprot:OHS99573.1 Myb-like DNA-binding domain containing protein [Tritrichomonas foetus]
MFNIKIRATRNLFTEEEDKLLLKYVEMYGKNWMKISSLIPNRTTRQCRERYLKYLSPDLTHVKWTPEEDKLLMEKVSIYGNKWNNLLVFFKGRTDINLRNRWMLLKRRAEKHAEKVEQEALSSPKMIESTDEDYPQLCDFTEEFCFSDSFDEFELNFDNVFE